MKIALIAAMTLALGTTAFADQLKSKAMTDKDMDKVTAGAQPYTLGGGIATANDAGGQANPSLPTPPANVIVSPGSGTSTRTF